MDKLNYRQLQAFAKVMKLPGNMKYQVLWELVQARRSGNERLVSQLLAEQNRIRVNRRLNRRVAKIQAEALGRLIRQEENNNAAPQYNNMNHANNISNPPEETQMVDPEIKHSVASLLDAQQRYNIMMNEARFCRSAVVELPIQTHTVYNQFSGYHCPPPSCSSTAPVPAYSNSVNLNSLLDLGNPEENIGHIEVIATEFRAKPPPFRSNELKKPSFQVVASTTGVLCCDLLFSWG
ncbi:hypothetical protein GE061_005935 [Apolygus lucorum]|uniref:Uncharacterized protein n=1 Tax=Apolygus lucorum TaxID=248454 RepID=A0A8S9WSJ8_APOLU|nr:hypothetical protein GE061_005935 [Apolygus lucorum]